MLLKIKSDYNPASIEVTSNLLNQIWDDPESVGGGASYYATNGGSVWRTKEGWGFSRSGSKPWGWIQFHDPRPGRGDTRWDSSPFQTESQAAHKHPAARNAVVV